MSTDVGGRGQLNASEDEMGDQRTYKLRALVHQESHRIKKKEIKQNYLWKQTIRLTIPRIAYQIGTNEEESALTVRIEEW